MNKFWNNDNNENGNSTQVQTQAGRNNMKKLTLGIITGVAFTIVIGTSAMLSTADNAQASEEFAGRISVSSSMPKLLDHANGVLVDESEVSRSNFKLTDPRNGVFADESAVTLNTFKLTDRWNGVYADESAIESSLIDVESYRDNQNPMLVDHANGVLVDESEVSRSSFKLTDPRNGVFADESAVTN